MSATLGPIHYWLYNKIKIQEKIVDDIIDFGTKYNLNLQEECDHLYGVSHSEPLEDIINTDNIHGWLQEKVTQIEYKLAYCVNKILTKDQDSINSLTALMQKNGETKAKSLNQQDLNATILYKEINDSLLDGMPCDHANRLIEHTNDLTTWSRNVCVHASYWNEVGGDIDVYYTLRDAFINGLVKDSGYQYIKVDPVTYSIRKDG